MRIIIVDKNDQIIGAKDRADVEPGDIYRVAALWIFNSQSEVLIAQRAFDKKHDPGRWGPSVGGTVEEGETYEQNITKEAEEELGIKNYQFQKGPKYFRDGEHKFFVQFYFLKLDVPITHFKVYEKEVAQIQWINIAKLRDETAKHPLYP